MGSIGKATPSIPVAGSRRIDARVSAALRRCNNLRKALRRQRKVLVERGGEVF